MKARRRIVLLAALLLAGSLGISRGLAVMKKTYDGSCGELSGFPGLLQRTHFFDLGDCKTKPNPGHPPQCKTVGEPCKPAPSGKAAGKCANSDSGCQCVAK